MILMENKQHASLNTNMYYFIRLIINLKMYYNVTLTELIPSTLFY